MGLITKIVEVKLNSRNVKHYEDLYYEIPRYNLNNKLTVKHGTKITVKVEDLTNGSGIKVDVECDGCGKELKPMPWKTYKVVHLNYMVQGYKID